MQDLLVVGFNLSKDDKEKINRMLSLSAKAMKMDLKYEITDIRTGIPENLPLYILSIGETAGEFLLPRIKDPSTLVISIPSIATFWEDQTGKEKVWIALKGMLLSLQKGLLESLKCPGLDKSRLVLDASAVVKYLNREDFISTIKKTVIGKGTLILETAEGANIFIYPEEIDKPGKNVYEFSADEFFTLMSALLLFDASKAKLEKERL